MIHENPRWKATVAILTRQHSLGVCIPKVLFQYLLVDPPYRTLLLHVVLVDTIDEVLWPGPRSVVPVPHSYGSLEQGSSLLPWHSILPGLWWKLLL